MKAADRQSYSLCAPGNLKDKEYVVLIRPNMLVCLQGAMVVQIVGREGVGSSASLLKMHATDFHNFQHKRLRRKVGQESSRSQSRATDSLHLQNPRVGCFHKLRLSRVIIEHVALII